MPFAFTHHVRDTCLCLHVQRAARALARRFDDALRPLDLTQGQFSLLIVAQSARSRRASASVAALLAMDRTTLTAESQAAATSRLGEGNRRTGTTDAVAA